MSCNSTLKALVLIKSSFKVTKGTKSTDFAVNGPDGVLVPLTGRLYIFNMIQKSLINGELLPTCSFSKCFFCFMAYIYSYKHIRCQLKGKKTNRKWRLTRRYLGSKDSNKWTFLRCLTKGRNESTCDALCFKQVFVYSIIFNLLHAPPPRFILEARNTGSYTRTHTHTHSAPGSTVRLWPPD